MIVYEADLAKGYEMVNFVNYEEGKAIRRFNGKSLVKHWQPALVRRERVSSRSAAKAADLPYAHDALILRRSAVDALRDVLDAHGEILPLATEDEIELFVFNPRYVIDALDRNESTIEPIEGTSAITIRKYAFVEPAIRDVEIFRMPVGPHSNYFSDRFVERVKKAKLKGTEFIKLWSSDDS